MKRTRHRCVIGLVYANLLWLHITYGQRSSLSFGPTVDLPLSYAPVTLGIVPPFHGGRGAIAVAGENAIILYSVSDQGLLTPARSLRTGQSPQRIAVADINGDGVPDFVGLARGGTSVGMLISRGTAYAETVYSVEEPAQSLVIADINNDGRKDILLFGRSMAGVATLLGKTGGTFSVGPVIVPEISVSDLRALDLNGDGITDMVLLNWLSNQMVLFFGISRGIFSEQISIDLPGEPADITLSPVTRQRTVRAAVTLPGERKICVLTGNAAGEFAIDQAIPIPWRMSGIQFADFNADGLPDIVTATEKGIVVAMAETPTEFAPATTFGIGAPARAWGVGDLDGDQRPDIALVDRRERRLVVAANASHTGKVSWGPTYAVGTFPRGIAVVDLDGDGAADIAAVNSTSATLSLLRNRGNGELEGQRSFPVPEHPSAITLATPTSTTSATFVTSHQSTDHLGIIRVTDDPTRWSMTDVPTSASPEVLFAREDTGSQRLQVLVRTRIGRDRTLSLFEELPGHRFLERSLRPTMPSPITALVVDDFTGGAGDDLVYAVCDKAAGRSTVSLAEGRGRFEFGTVREILSYPDSLGTTRSLLSGRFGRETDIIVVLSAPDNAVGIAYAAGKGEFSQELDWIRGLQPLNEECVLVRDVDGDDNADIVLIDTIRNAVVVLYGKPGRGFLAPSVICSAEGVTGIGVGPVHPGMTDLVTSHGAKGTVSVLFNPFRHR
jgi:hypothetical protein